jgi:RNA 3'-terminal phosphate cyclase-like protein
MALRYEGCAQFRQRIVAATLSQKSLRIDKIRDQDDSPGLHDFEANFLRLIEKITDGRISFLSLKFVNLSIYAHIYLYIHMIQV